MNFKNIKNKIGKSDFFGSVAILVSSQFISQLISFLTLPIVSRLYSETDYGNFAIFSSTTAIILGIGAIGLNSAIMAPKELNKSKDVFFAAFVIQSSILTFFFVLALLIAPFFKFFKISSFPYTITLILSYIYMIIYGLNSLLIIYVNKLKLNKLLFWNTLIGTLSTLFITIPLGYFKFGFLGFVFASIVASIVICIQMMTQANPFYRKLNFKEIISICKEYKDYIIYQFPSNWVNTFTLQLPNQIFSRAFGNTTLGGYAMSERMMGIPIRLIASPVTTIYFRHATQLVNEGKNDELSNFTLSFALKFLKLAFIPVSLFMIFSKDIFGFVLGENWRIAGTIASIMSIQYVFKFIEQSFSYCLVVLGKQKINFFYSIIYFLVITISLFIGVFYFRKFIPAIICLTIGSLFMQIISLSLNFHYLGISKLKYLIPFLLFILGVLAFYMLFKCVIFS